MQILQKKIYLIDLIETFFQKVWNYKKKMINARW